MYTKTKGDNKAKLSILFLVVALCVGFATGVITSYMADNGCSKIFIVVACFSFFYFAVNVYLMSSSKAWERNTTWFVFLLLLGVVVVSLLGLGYSIAQSVCDLSVCGRDYQNHADDFWDSYNKNDRKKNFEDQWCGNVSDDWISYTTIAKMSTYSGTSSGSFFYIKRGWPIAFTVIQSVLSIIQLILTFFNLFSCSGCKPRAVNKGVTY